MAQAIVTKYLGPTNVRGSRVKATCQGGSVTLNWDDSQNPSDNHRAAAIALADKLDWCGKWLAGGLPSGESVWVCETQDSRDWFAIHPIPGVGR